MKRVVIACALLISASAIVASAYGQGSKARDFGESYDAKPAILKKALLSTTALPANPAARKIVLAALRRASIQVNADKAFECWKNENCDTGTGGPVTAALFNGWCGDVYRQVLRMEFTLQALTYPQIGKIISVCSDYTVPKQISDFRSLIAQGANVIVGYMDAADALLPAMREARDRGIPVITFAGNKFGQPGIDYTSTIQANLCKEGALGAAAMNQHIKNGQIALLGGIAGNATSPQWQKCARSSLANGNKVVASPDTGWTRQGTFQAVSGVLTKYPNVKGFVYDYADAAVGLIRAYLTAHRPLNIVLAVLSDENSLICSVKKLRNPNFRIYLAPSYYSEVRMALTATMMQRAGAAIPAQIVLPPVLESTTERTCDPEIPSSASPTALISHAMFHRMFP